MTASKDLNDFPFYGRRVSVGVLQGSYGPVVVTTGEHVGCCGIYRDDDDCSGEDMVTMAVVYLEGEKEYRTFHHKDLRRIGYFDPNCIRS